MLSKDLSPFREAFDPRTRSALAPANEIGFTSPHYPPSDREKDLNERLFEQAILMLELRVMYAIVPLNAQAAKIEQRDKEKKGKMKEGNKAEGFPILRRRNRVQIHRRERMMWGNVKGTEK